MLKHKLLFLSDWLCLFAFVFLLYVFLQSNVYRVSSKNPQPKSIVASFPQTIERRYLPLTGSILINKHAGCGRSNLTIVVHSTIDHFQARMAIRKTWGGYLVREHRISVFFLVGTSVDGQIMQAVNEEESLFGDILQAAPIDSYYNLTLKTMSMMAWVGHSCHQARYVLKIDDDAFVNVDHLVRFSKLRPPFQPLIIGYLYRYMEPIRWADKNALAYWAYNDSHYPRFVQGLGYFFTGDAADRLYRVAMNEPAPIYLEDVFITGIVAEKAAIPRLHHSLIRPSVFPSLNEYNYPKLMFNHGHKPEQIVRLWQRLFVNRNRYLFKKILNANKY